MKTQNGLIFACKKYILLPSKTHEGLHVQYSESLPLHMFKSKNLSNYDVVVLSAVHYYNLW